MRIRKNEWIEIANAIDDGIILYSGILAGLRAAASYFRTYAEGMPNDPTPPPPPSPDFKKAA